MAGDHRILRALAPALAAIVLLTGAPTVAGGASATVELKRIASFSFRGATDRTTGGTDIDFSGRYAYVMQRGNFGGVHIYDVSGPKPRKIRFVHCPGDQNDVAVVRPGLIAVGYHSSGCPGVDGGGIRLIDVEDPASPRLLGAIELPPRGTHTLTAYPGKPLVYTNTSTGQGIVDVSDPHRPKVVWRLENEGCHDLTFDLRANRKLAFCPQGGSGITEIWDVADPRSPRVVSRIANPAIPYHHSAIVTTDGKHLVIGDEAVGTCVSAPTGALWIYNIEDLSMPELVSTWAPENRLPGSASGFSRGCGTVHNFNLVAGTDILVSAWMEGGLILIDLSDPENPLELTHYDDPETAYWSAYYFDGRIYATDMDRGLDVFRLTLARNPK